MVELKPCPFCGGTKIMLNHDYGGGGWSYVMCEVCRCETERFPKTFMFSSDELAIEAWNRRATDE